MITELRLPQYGMGMSEAVVVRWLKNEGEAVVEQEPLVEVEAEKVDAEVAAPRSGILLEIVAPAGTSIEVHSVLAVLGDPGDEPPPRTGLPPRATAPDDPPTPRSSTRRTQSQQEGSGQVTPRARKLARDLGIDLATVSGSGAGGRITEDDVRGVAASNRPEQAEPDC